MATLTKAQAFDLMKKSFVAYIAVGNNAISAFLTDFEDFNAILKGDYSGDLKAAFQDFRGALSNAMSFRFLQEFFIPILNEFMKITQKTTSDPQTMVTELYEYMLAQTDTIKSRGITYDTIHDTGTPVGDPDWYRLTVDENGYDLEGIFFDKVNIICTADQTSGRATRHYERFKLEGNKSSADNLDFFPCDRSGSEVEIALLGPTSGLLENSDLASIDYNTTTKQLNNYASNLSEDIDGWVAYAPTANKFLIQDETISSGNDWYPTDRKDDDNDEPKSLRWLEATQYIEYDLKNTPINPDIPYFVGVWVNREIGSYGTGGQITLTLGAQSQTFTLTTETGWIKLVMTLDKDLWPKNWSLTDKPKFKITHTTYNSGYVLLYEPKLAPMEFFNGTWIIGWGKTTPPVRDDAYYYDDALAGSDSILQKAVAMATIPNVRHLPHDASPTIADPS